MTPQQKLESAAEDFASDNRGYDFFKDNVPFAVDMKKCFLAGAKYMEEEMMPLIVEVKKIIEAYDAIPDVASLALNHPVIFPAIAIDKLKRQYLLINSNHKEGA